jgi:type I restriction enzyme S subunit
MAQAVFTDTFGSILHPSTGSDTTSIGNWLRFVNGFAFKSSTYLGVGKYKIITIKNVQDGLVDSAGASCLDELPAGFNSACVLAFGDVLLSLTGNVGRVGIVTMDNLLLNQRVAKFDPIKRDLLPYWYFLFRQLEMKDHLINIAKGTAQQNLSPVETLKTEIAFDESTAVEYVKVVSPMFWAIAENRKESARLAALRDTLLPHLMSGELSVVDLICSK